MDGKRGDNMLLGLDVGGTFTDGVAIAEGKIVSMVKTPTTHGNLLQGILTAVDKVVEDTGSRVFERIALSTTIVTNALVEGNIEKVGLCIMPGPGMNILEVLPVEPYILSGYIDHRGREVAKAKQEEVAAACRHFSQCDVFAVSGKFAVRNPQVELTVAEWIKQQVNPIHTSVGSEVSGALNFLRRTNSAYYNAAVWRHFNGFATAVEEALRARGISAPVDVLKADGGTLPLSVARKYPVEAIFTGPAASVLGIMAMNGTNLPAVSLDIGGTTTDIALWEKGLPLFREQGASVGDYVTAVRAFRLKSVGVGGDSFARQEDGVIKVGPMRHGSAMAVGGSKPTVTDAMVALGMIDFGNRQLALKAMEQLALEGQSSVEASQLVLTEAVRVICQAIDSMLREQAAEPVYRVEDIVHGTSLTLEQVVGVGGGAAGLVPLIAKKMGLVYQLPQYGMVANAIGAAVARPTLDITLRVDTAQGYYTVAELGIKNKLQSPRFSLEDAYLLAEQHLAELANVSGIPLVETEMIHSEEFNVIHGFRTVGKIMTCRLQVKPGVLLNPKEGL
jgi:N-methylhydantoinase A/oxoprolinase/acetone carboxylase beta subunit